MKPLRSDDIVTACQPLLVLAVLTTLLLLGTGMTSCCPAPARPTVLGKTEIRKLESGNYEVSAGWMERRRRYERAILKQCPDR